MVLDLSSSYYFPVIVIGFREYACTVLLSSRKLFSYSNFLEHVLIDILMLNIYAI